MTAAEKRAQAKANPKKDLVRIPTKRRGHKILAKRGNDLKWFTKMGWDLLCDINVQIKGESIKKKKQGWTIVDPNSLNPAPDPIKKTEE